MNLVNELRREKGMTQSEFNNYRWSKYTTVMYNGEIYNVTGVDFSKNTIEIKTGEYHFDIPFEEIEIFEP